MIPAWSSATTAEQPPSIAIPPEIASYLDGGGAPIGPTTQLAAVVLALGDTTVSAQLGRDAAGARVVCIDLVRTGVYGVVLVDSFVVPGVEIVGDAPPPSTEWSDG